MFWICLPMAHFDKKNPVRSVSESADSHLVIQLGSWACTILPLRLCTPIKAMLSIKPFLWTQTSQVTAALSQPHKLISRESKMPWNTLHITSWIHIYPWLEHCTHLIADLKQHVCKFFYLKKYVYWVILHVLIVECVCLDLSDLNPR